MKARLPQGVGSQPQNMNAMIKQAQKMQEEMNVKQAEIEAEEFKATAGGGMVEVIMMGNKQIKEVTIKPEVVDPTDIDMLQDLIVAAINESIRMVEEKMATEMEKITGGLNVPGMF